MRQVYTYFIQAVTGGPIKIGKALNPHMRLKELQVGSPIKLQLVGVLEGDHEREWHIAYKATRLHGEWFMDTPCLIDDINRLCENGCATDEDLNELVMASLVKIETMRGMIFTYEENIKPSVIRRWAYLDKVCDPSYVPPPPQLTLFTQFDEGAA